MRPSGARWRAGCFLCFSPPVWRFRCAVTRRAHDHRSVIGRAAVHCVRTRSAARHGFSLPRRAQLCIKRVLLIDAYLPSEPHLAMQGGYVVHCKEAPEPLTKANQAMTAIDSIAGDVTNGSTPLYTGQTALDAAPAMSRPILHERHLTCVTSTRTLASVSNLSD